ncbi:hypothetical protein XENORESO_005389 [Xenotaenia resolanae]|uniref:Uncharacterized protein n=1 Tax=Xenotaenia resolanae TaxID=208358 RepID=A0ABV0VS57_9TELE
MLCRNAVSFTVMTVFLHIWVYALSRTRHFCPMVATIVTSMALFTIYSSLAKCESEQHQTKKDFPGKPSYKNMLKSLSLRLFSKTQCCNHKSNHWSWVNCQHACGVTPSGEYQSKLLKTISHTHVDSCLT